VLRRPFEAKTRHSPRNGFTAYFALSPGTGVLAPVTRATRKRCTSLTSAPGGQNHTISSSRHAVRRRSVSSAAARHVHRIPLPTSVTIAKRPSGATERTQNNADFAKLARNLCFTEGLDRFSDQRIDLPDGWLDLTTPGRPTSAFEFQNVHLGVIQIRIWNPSDSVLHNVQYGSERTLPYRYPFQHPESSIYS
jgi:hypothetical protein